MADYYPLLAKAVGGLQRSTPEARRAIYERARKALIGQLRAMNPPVPEADIEREDRALDEAIARLEREAGPSVAMPDPAPEIKSSQPVYTPTPPVPQAPEASPVPALIEPSPAPAVTEAPKARTTPVLPPLPPIPPRSPVAPLGPRAPVANAPAESAKVEAERDPESLAFPDQAPPAEDMPARIEPMRPIAPQPRAKHRGWIRYVAFLLLLAIIAGGIGFLAWRLRDRPEDLLRARPQTVAEQPEGPGKIVERIGGAPAATPAPAARPAATPPRPADTAPAPRPAEPPPAIAVALRAAMLVDAPEDPQKFRTFVGNVVWRVENTSRGPGQPLSQSVRAEADISDAKLKVTLLLQRNSDETLPASHLLTILFTPAAGSPFPAVDEIDIPQMRNEVSPSVDPLVGVPAKITANMFLVGLARDATFQIRNIDLLKTRGWVDIPLRFADGRIAKITFEKGPAGDRAIADAFQSWGQ